jgi:hypothetical protein
MVCENLNEYKEESENVFITYIGDTFERERVVWSSDDILNITGSTIYFTIKRDYNDSVLIQKEITEFDNPTLGEYKITIGSSETSELVVGKYVCDIKIKESNDKITTLFNGYFIVKNSVTIL